MLVGGPGRDIVKFPDSDDYPDVVRVRGGGADTVRCEVRLDQSDVLLVDGSDRVHPRCETARVLLSGEIDLGRFRGGFFRPSPHEGFF
jgi:hypothetical protein